jgi:hypothetical protein
MRAFLATALLALATTMAVATPANAMSRYRDWHHDRRDREVRLRLPVRGGVGDARPRAWCGWYMRQIMGVADRSYNLARNWAHWGVPSGPQVGAVVVWPHHVGKIVGRAAAGGWLVLSGNDGHAVRIRTRSLAGAIAFRI